MSPPKDLFSGHARQYASFRPTYPKALYDFILGYVKERNNAWDCACGNGQVARDLVPYFAKIEATDLSAKQIENAIPSLTIHYSVSPAEQTSFADDTFDLITVGQALHWLDTAAFYKEVNRVAKAGSVLAVWGYGLLRVTPSIDDKLHHFYKNVIGPYWDNERKFVDEAYVTLAFPFKEITAPSLFITVEWSKAQFYGYIHTWSAVVKYIEQHGVNPVGVLINDISPLWGDEIRTITFPLFLRLGVVEKE